MGKLKLHLQVTIGKCLDFLERSPVTADAISLIGWCAVGTIFPTIAAVAITGSFVSMGIMLAIERKGTVDHKAGQILDLVVTGCSLLWFIPAIAVYAAWYLAQSVGARVGACT
jgi:hypothetical protein